MYSFPWKRGPHDNLNDYLENVDVFDNLKQTVWTCINEYDWLSRFAVVYSTENDSWSKKAPDAQNSKVTMVCILKICLSMMRLKRETTEMILQSVHMMKVIHSAIDSNDSVLASLSITILTTMARHLASQRKDLSVLKIDIAKIYDMFISNAANDSLIASTACGLFSEILQNDPNNCNTVL